MIRAIHRSKGFFNSLIKTGESMLGQYKIDLTTKRLNLRNIISSDKDFIIDLWGDPEVTQFMGGPRSYEFMEEECAQQLLDPFTYEYDLWPVIERSTNTPIGHCGLLEKEVEGRSEVEVIYVIARTFWGRGFATEISGELIRYAYEVKGLKRIIALIKPDNTASAQVAKRLGMHKKKSILRNKNIAMDLYVRENP